MVRFSGFGSLKKFRKISTCDTPMASMTNVCIIDHHITRSFKSLAKWRPLASCWKNKTIKCESSFKIVERHYTGTGFNSVYEAMMKYPNLPSDNVFGHLWHPPGSNECYRMSFQQMSRRDHGLHRLSKKYSFSQLQMTWISIYRLLSKIDC